jgi:hypothetical protein
MVGSLVLVQNLGIAAHSTIIVGPHLIIAVQVVKRTTAFVAHRHRFLLSPYLKMPPVEERTDIPARTRSLEIVAVNTDTAVRVAHIVGKGAMPSLDPVPQ